MNRMRGARLGATSSLLLSGLLVLGALVACDMRRDEPSLPPVKSPQTNGHFAAALVDSFSAHAAEFTQIAQSQPSRPATSTPSTGAIGGRAVSADDVAFVSSAASAGTLEVEASRVALEKARTPAVRNFAQKMVDEHSKTGAELRALSVASSVGNVAALSPKDGEQLRRLKELQGREFDREYVAQIGVAAHQNAVNAFQKAADSASDKQVKTFAQAKLPALREHLQTAQSLAKQLGPPASSKDDPLATRAPK